MLINEIKRPLNFIAPISLNRLTLTANAQISCAYVA
jgi:hypothetical protein